jgi:hypothetical protein
VIGGLANIMKKSFPGYFVLSDKEYDDLWEKCIFCMDANVLLNLYRYSQQTRDELISILQSIQTRLWISHQAAYEFLDNRLEEISRQEKAYDEMIKKLDDIISTFKDKRRHPFIKIELLDKLSKTYAEVKKELETSKKENAELFHADLIQSKIVDLLEGRVGPAYSKEQLLEICKQGEERYKAKIPPGYKDEVKSTQTSIANNKYGDYVIWRQLLDKAKKDSIDIIYVTDERKEDWWRKVDGKMVGPRPELVQEFTDLTNQKYYMYQVDRFMEYAAKKMRREVKEEAIKEIREFRKEDKTRGGWSDLIKRDVENRNFYSEIWQSSSSEKLKKQIEALESEKLIRLWSDSSYNYNLIKKLLEGVDVEILKKSLYSITKELLEKSSVDEIGDSSRENKVDDNQEEISDK